MRENVFISRDKQNTGRDYDCKTSYSNLYDLEENISDEDCHNSSYSDVIKNPIIQKSAKNNQHNNYNRVNLMDFIGIEK